MSSYLCPELSQKEGQCSKACLNAFVLRAKVLVAVQAGHTCTHLAVHCTPCRTDCRAPLPNAAAKWASHQDQESKHIMCNANAQHCIASMDVMRLFPHMRRSHCSSQCSIRRLGLTVEIGCESSIRGCQHSGSEAREVKLGFQARCLSCL